MNLYHYDRSTAELIGTTLADFDPLDNLPLIPSRATDVAPPVATTGFVPVFDIVAGTWALVQDHRGTVVYDTSTGQQTKHEQIGPIPSSMTTIAPPTDDYLWNATASKWVLDASKAWVRIRNDRNRRMAITDFTQLSDAQLTAAQKTAWATYRQALRDITLQSDPTNIVWPTKPV